MYKIYINDTPLVLMESKEVVEAPPSSEDHLIARYTGKRKFLFSYIDMLEKSDRFKRVSLHSSDVEKLFQDFQANYKIIEAAGGLVFNSANELLMIYRRGSWDLPKGKLDKGETIEAAAVREVQEETGLDKIDLGQGLPTTYHTYKNGKGTRVLKKTYWFIMKTEENELVPQTEEDIEKAVWVNINTFLSQPQKVYGNVEER